MTLETLNLETLMLHAGSHRRDLSTNSVAVPIHQTTSYEFDSTEHAGKLFALQELGNIYTRITNPTTQVLEERVTSLEGGASAVAVSSGSAAVSLAIQNVASAGDNIVVSPHLYGGTYNLFTNTLPKMGIEVRFADPAKPDSFAELSDDNTRAYFGETLPNPKLIPFPISEVSEIGRMKGIPLIVDNTAAPVTCRPFDHGAAVIVHSLTKFIGGHGTSIGGIIIDSGNFDWLEFPDQQPNFNTPDGSYHGAIWGSLVPEALGAPIAYAIRARVVLLRDLGQALSPFNAFQLIQGLETLPLRFNKHQENAEKLTNYLNNHKDIVSVIYPSLFEGADKILAEKYLSSGNGALIGIELKGGADAGRSFIDNLKLIYHVANIGDARTLAIHPASTTHSQLSADDQLKAGVTPGYVRLSVGIEHIDDIIADIDQALKA
ncbi:PLP-dependent transferase [Amylibacter sp.]|jgi:O-acetylhomoserine (thiol)-lyase|nr:PLP-dependent transferase [Amylibacter sp.]MDB4235731.1 PLP-dependent transferase [bacterium]MDB9960085.1 PLP-dependent transferase [Amylibacter sp.]MDC1243296.1 PLP-dependent transferase [Amylibacter sp.]|tara:strand:+ start:771 stop:2069 length:1299 start_codon:yes stop_codon:yes gene_type:complete